MNINILCVGKIKEDYILSAIKEYSKRISKYATFKIVEVSDEKIPVNPSEKEIESIRKIETDKMRKYIKPSDYVIMLDLTGKELSSEEFANKIQDITINGYSTIDFIIGGSLGIDRTFINECNFSLCFSKLTFPHQLIRLFLTEQVFRCFKIISGEKYHL